MTGTNKSVKEPPSWRKKFSVMDEKSEIRNDEPSDTSETEVEQLLRETITEIGMSIEKCKD